MATHIVLLDSKTQNIKDVHFSPKLHIVSVQYLSKSQEDFYRQRLDFINSHDDFEKNKVQGIILYDITASYEV